MKRERERERFIISNLWYKLPLLQWIKIRKLEKKEFGR
jgi:hypothetical protein